MFIMEGPNPILSFMHVTTIALVGTFLLPRLSFSSFHNNNNIVLMKEQLYKMVFKLK